MSALDNATSGFLEHLIKQITETHSQIKTAFIAYHGPIDYNFIEYYKDEIEELADKAKSLQIDTLNIIINTPGGSVEAVEKMVEINRYHFKTVNFYVPDMAMSAGTIFCMSGDEIYMDYASSLGPIDPQVMNEQGKWVPALGYLDKYEELIQKSLDDKISGVEFARFQNIDLAQLSRYEQAKLLSIDLLKKWLVEYKFKDWETHSSTSLEVTCQEKIERAEHVASMLMDTSVWRSHGRMIGINTLISVLKLKINDYSENRYLRSVLNQYIELLGEYATQRQRPVYIHSNARSLGDEK